MKKKTIVEVNSLEETKGLAKEVAKNLKSGDIICLYGDLGSGKTYFTKFLCEALGVDPNLVISPTFVYWREYKSEKGKINHFDFYRIKDSSDLKGVGFEEAAGDRQSITIIEWADRIKAILPKERTDIFIKIVDDKKRIFEIRLNG